MSGKFALIIGNTEYSDPKLEQLSAPGRDAEEFARVLKSPEVCAFDEVNILLNQPEFIVSEAIDGFFDERKPDDLLLLYFSGHGVRDELGALYLAVQNTNRFRLRSTAIKSDFIRDAMDQCRSRRQVLILDCCNSGAFAQGTKAAMGVSIGTAPAFQGGYGRVILTASDSTQFAWEGDKIIGETDNSLFTHFLVEGLEGEADLDGDGRITVDELYDYAYEMVKLATPKQTPSKFSSQQKGEIVLRHNIHIEDIKPMPLPNELIDEIEDTRPYVREAAVQKLDKIVKGKNISLARSAREALEKIAIDENTTRRVAQMATQVLESVRQVEQKAEEERKAREEAERLATLKPEEDRLAREKAVAEQKAREEAEKLARAKAKQEAAERVAEREAAEKAAKEKAKKEEARERETMELAARRKAEREATERESARRRAELLDYRKAVWDKIANYLQNVPKNKSNIYIFFGLAILLVAVLTFLAFQLSPNIIPDNKTLPFSGVSAGEVNIYWYDDEKVTKLTQSQEGVRNLGPASYTSGRIYFTSDRTGKAEIHVLIKENEGKVLRITDTPGDAESWSPAVNASGDVYFTSDRSGKAEIYALTKEGNLSQITDTPGEAESWSPIIRGRNTFFTSNRDGKNKVYILVPQSRATAISAFESWTERSPNPFPYLSP